MRTFLSILFALTVAATASRARTLDDFEDGDLFAAPGLGWIPLTDEQFGGTSTVTLEAVHPGAAGSRGAMRLRGRAQKSDAPMVIAGTWLSLEGRGGPVNLSAYDRLRFRIRGECAALEVGLRRGLAARVPYNAMTPVQVGRDWQVVDVPFTTLRAEAPAAPETAWDPSDVWYLGFSTPVGAETEIDVQIDDVELVAVDAGAQGVAGGGATSSGATQGASAASADAPVYAAVTELTPANEVAAFPWIEMTQDPAGDGRFARLPDARSLWYHYDERTDRVWFRVGIQNQPLEDAFGMNVALDVDRDPGNGMAWWGTNKEFRFDRLVTAYLFRVGSRWQGSLGVADSAGVSRGEMASLALENVVAGVDREKKWIFVGAPRTAIDPDLDMHFIATVGSAMAANDDVPGDGFAWTQSSGGSAKRGAPPRASAPQRRSW